MAGKDNEPNENTNKTELALYVFGFLTAVELMSLFVHLGDLAMAMVWQETYLTKRLALNLLIDVACLVPLIPITAVLAKKNINNRR